MTPQSDPVLKRFRHELDKLYSDRLERVVLFGSRARGDFGADCDYDVAIFLRDCTDISPELRLISDIATDIMADTHAYISPLPFQAGAYTQRTLLMHDERVEGID